MLPAIELRARIVQVRSLAPGETIANNNGWSAKRRTRLALVSAGTLMGIHHQEVLPTISCR
jgi:alanine racemase